MTTRTQGRVSLGEIQRILTVNGVVGATVIRNKRTTDHGVRSLWGLHTDVRDALSALHHATPRDYATPCSEYPERWDAVPLDVFQGEVFKAVVFEVWQAADACLDCKMFLLCRQVADANAAQKKPPIVGVIAGELQDSTTSGALIRSAMEELRWTA